MPVNSALDSNVVELHHDAYETHLKSIIADATMALDGRKGKPDLEQLTIGLDLAKDNSSVRSWALANGITKAAWAAAIQRLRVIKTLGAYPASPSHLVELFVAHDRVECLYGGLLRQQPRTYRVLGKETVLDDLELAALCPKERAVIAVAMKTESTPIEFALRIKVFAADNGIKFSEQVIDNAVMYWHDATQYERLDLIFGTVMYTHRLDGKNVYAAMWHDLVTRTFACGNTSPEFVAAVLQKFIWQVKRKILKLSITSHLMPVILGDQGAGKSMFVEMFISPLAELVKTPDFGEIGDSRNIELWRAYIFFIDEMGRASRADVDTIKNRMTASTLDLRPMRTNKIVQVRNCATMIGNSNKAMEQLIVDPTGIRRFAPITFLAKELAQEHWKYTKDFDFTMLWQSVDEHGPDPMLEFANVLATVQSEHKAYGPVEQWLLEFDPASIKISMRKDGFVRDDNLWKVYSQWEIDNMPGARQLSKRGWVAEMKRVVATDHLGKKYGFGNRKRDKASEGFCWVGREEVES